MTIQRADPLYPVNSTTVDSAAGIDIRLLDSAQAGATDSDQSVRFTHTQDGQERTFDPDTALVTTETDPLTFQGEGWALRLTEDHTPADDTNCNSMLTAGTLTVNVRALVNMNGGTNTGGNTTITFRASLWRYHMTDNTGISIASGSQATTWDTSALGAENNTRKNTAISITVTQTEFLASEVLLLQIGCEGTTLPDATLGTTNFDVTLDVDDAATNLDFAASQGIRIWCRLTGDTIGKGTVAAPTKAATMSKSLVGKGVPTMTRAVVAAKSFSLVGKGTATHTKAIAEDFDLVGKGVPTFSRVVVAAKSFSLVGKGTVATPIRALALTRSAVGKGVATMTRAVVATKTFSLVGKGVITEVHPVQAFRTFNLVGKGEVLTTGTNASTITMPIDEVPTEGGGTTVIKRVVNVFDD